MRQSFTPQEELDIYKTALADYLKPGNDNSRWKGLCYYFLQVQSVYLYRDFDLVLPELYLTNPDLDNDIDPYWFEMGLKAPRIKCLRQAIKNMKHIYNLK